MIKKSLDEFLNDFNLSEPYRGQAQRGKPLTIWLSDDDKIRYDKIQRNSGRRFNRKLKEIVLAAIDYLESKAS